MSEILEKLERERRTAEMRIIGTAEAFIESEYESGTDYWKGRLAEKMRDYREASARYSERLDLEWRLSMEELSPGVDDA